jgi:Ca-activated chloride channel homolog
MMNEMDELKQAFAQERIDPRPAAKDAAVTAALVAFDARNTASRQGSRSEGRLRVAARAALDILTGRRPMQTNHALLGGVSLAVLTLAVVTAASLQTMDGFNYRESPVVPANAPEEQQAADAVTAERRNEEADLDAAPPPEQEMADLPLMDVQSSVPAAGVPAQGAAPQYVQRQASATAEGLAKLAGADELSAAAAPPAMRQEAMQQAAPLVGDIAPTFGYQDQGRDNFETIEANPVKVAAEEPVSTFSIDVDTASYSFMRASLNNGVLPQEDAVRVEELINYFPYDYAGPAEAGEPFAAHVQVMQTPWNAETKLLHIGIKGFDIAVAEQPRANLVFLIDTSGSMDAPNKLPLLINAMKLLVDTLRPEDKVSIVAYAGSAGTILEPTAAADKAKIIAALENLGAGGSTAGAEGIRQAYQLAEQSFVEGGVNRVILATDGDFNVGITDIDELQSFVEREREDGIFLSVLGFGMGNYNDQLMQALSDNGNGAAAYIDTLAEARKVLVEEATSTLFPIAKDVKVQVEFNPATVAEYRLIGYETRLLNREDFNNDRIDAGEIGSGHTVTALYEITPAGSPAALVDNLRYGAAPSATTATTQDKTNEYGFLRIRYKLPEENESRLIETPISTDEIAANDRSTEAREARFATSVAAFGQILRGGRYTGDYSLDDVISLAGANKGEDEFGYRAEFINLARLAKSAASMERLQP